MQARKVSEWVGLFGPLHKQGTRGRVHHIINRRRILLRNRAFLLTVRVSASSVAMASTAVDGAVVNNVLSSSDQQDIERALSQLLDGQLGVDDSSRAGTSKPPESAFVLLLLPDNMCRCTIDAAGARSLTLMQVYNAWKIVKSTPKPHLKLLRICHRLSHGEVCSCKATLAETCSTPFRNAVRSARVFSITKPSGPSSVKLLEQTLNLDFYTMEEAAVTYGQSARQQSTVTPEASVVRVKLSGLRTHSSSRR